jgi:hypothetical protein
MFWFSSRLFVPLTFGRKYSRSRKLKILLVFFSLIRTFAGEIMHFTGIIIAVATFLTIGIWHPIVIKTEYYFGTRAWWVYLLIGVACIAAALFIENTVLSAVVGVFGASALWGIGELFAQKRRVEKGWFPKNPKRRYD